MNAKLRDIYALDGPFLNDSLARLRPRPHGNRHRHQHAPAFRSLRREHARSRKTKSSPLFPARVCRAARRIRTRQAIPPSATAPATSTKFRADRSRRQTGAARSGSCHRAGRGIDSRPGPHREHAVRETNRRRQNRFFFADLVPTAAHLPLPWIMGYDLYPMTTLENKKKWIPEAIQEGWLALFGHDPNSGGLRPRTRRQLGTRTRQGGLSMAKTAKQSKKSAKSNPKKEPVKIGIIGGSGLYHMPGLTDTREVRVKTPFGDPSDAIVIGTLEGKRVAFLARHGRGHSFSPSEINYRANVCAMKMLGVERIISVSAVGSLRDDLPPLDFLIPDQFFDRTRPRLHVFRRRDRRARRIRQAHLHASFSARRRGLRPRRREGASRRHLRLHGRAAIFDARRIAHLSPVAFRRDRHDQSDRSQARARSGDLLRHGRHDHGLRLLASATRRGDPRGDHRQSEAQQRQRADASCTKPFANCPMTAAASARSAGPRDSHGSLDNSRGNEKASAPIIGKYVE